MWVGRFRFHDDRIVCGVNVTINGSYVMTAVPLIISGNGESDIVSASSVSNFKQLVQLESGLLQDFRQHIMPRDGSYTWYREPFVALV